MAGTKPVAAHPSSASTEPEVSDSTTMTDLAASGRLVDDLRHVFEVAGLRADDEQFDPKRIVRTLIRKHGSRDAGVDPIWNKQYVNCQILDTDGIYYPQVDYHSPVATNVYLSIQGGQQDPHLLLKTRVKPERRGVVARESRLEFSLSLVTLKPHLVSKI